MIINLSDYLLSALSGGISPFSFYILFLYSLFFIFKALKPVACSSHSKRQGHKREIPTMQAHFKPLFIYFLKSYFSNKVTWSSPKSRSRQFH